MPTTKWEVCVEKEVVTHLIWYSSTCLEGVRKNGKAQDNRRPRRESKMGRPENEAQILTEQSCLSKRNQNCV
jgi:hypothetical protein